MGGVHRKNGVFGGGGVLGGVGWFVYGGVVGG